jgi:hypothetical protein
MSESIAISERFSNATDNPHGNVQTTATGLFSKYAAVGFRIIPNIPHNATISPTTKSLTNANRGKTPGAMKTDGTWVGYSGWQNVVASSQQIELWDSWPGAGIGILCGGTIGLDIDMMNEKLSERVEKLALKMLGDAPQRVGQAPKRLLPYRITEPCNKVTLQFTKDADEQKLEVLGVGQQFVVDGIHPKTGKPYKWTRGTLLKTGFDGLTEVTHDQMDKFLSAVVKLMEDTGYELKVTNAGGAQSWSGSGRRGPIEDIRACLEIVPNDDPNWSEWNRMAMAIWAASNGSDEGFEAFDRWSQKWREYDAENTRARWDAISGSPPTELGMGTLIYRARQVNPNFKAKGWNMTEAMRVIEKIGGGVSLIDLDQFRAADKDKPVQEQDPDVALNKNFELPPLPEHPKGAVGDLARYIEAVQPYHSRPAAAAFALGLMSRISSHRYVAKSCVHPSGTALNLYIMFAGPTGLGKNIFLDVAQHISDATKIGLLPVKFASEQAINRHLSEAHRRPVLLFNDEYGIKLKMLKKSGETLAGIQRYIMELFGNAMITSGGRMYSKEKDNLKEVRSPYLINMAVSTKTELEGGLDETSARNGSVNRFVYVEHDGGVGQRRYDFDMPDVPQSVRAAVKRLWRDPNLPPLTEEALAADECKPLPFNTAANRVIKEYSDDVDAVRTQYSDSIRDVLMARLVENAIKIAGLVALGRGEKEVSKADAIYGVQFMQYSISRVLPFVHSAIERGTKNDYAIAPKLEARLQEMINDPDAFVAGSQQAQRKGWGRYLKHGFVTRSLMTHAVKNISRNTAERDDAIAFMLEAEMLHECGKITVRRNEVTLYALEQRGREAIDACAAEFD